MRTCRKHRRANSTAPRTHPPSPRTIRSRPSARTTSTPASPRSSGPGFQVGLDGYYKRAKNQLDDGLFGQTLILSAFNYARGEVYGARVHGLVFKGGFTTYLNLAHSVAKGEDWNSAQFLFSPDDLAYVRNHWISSTTTSS